MVASTGQTIHGDIDPGDQVEMEPELQWSSPELPTTLPLHLSLNSRLLAVLALDTPASAAAVVVA